MAFVITIFEKLALKRFDKGVLVLQNQPNVN
jgi:hypothetical protein